MTLDVYRAELDRIDKTLEENFVRRMEVVSKIREYKKEHGLPTLDASREARILELHTKDAPEVLKPYLEDYFRGIMALSRRYQDEK